jgi:hypothetical protein
MLTICFVVNSCIIVKEFSVEEEELAQKIRLAPMPEVEMSELYVRSSSGDMVALLPKDWFFVNVEEKMNSDVIAVAVNQDYTLSAVFTEIKKNEQVESQFKKQGLIGIASLSIDEANKKSPNTVKMIGNFKNLVLGNNSFVQFEQTITGGVTSTKNVVFQSNLNNYYRFSLVPITVMGKELPTQFEFNKIFNSILATIKY